MSFDEKKDLARLLEIANELTRISPEHRQAFIEANTKPGSKLRDRAESLLTDTDLTNEHVGTAGVLPIVEDLTVPTMIGPYRVIDRLGAGSMGEVFLARKVDADYEHDVAVKLLPRMHRTDASRQQFRTERQILASLRHSNIAQMYDGGEMQDGTPYIVMEYIEGHTLQHLLERQALSFEDKIRCFEQVCRAVAYAHENDVSHRDISLNNILVSSENLAKVLDFGISLKTTLEQPSLALADGIKKDIRNLGHLLQKLLEEETPLRALDLNAIKVKSYSDPPYASARQLLQDVRAYRLGYPVSARQSSKVLRVKRLLQRHCAAATAIAILATSTALGAFTLGVSIFETHKNASKANENLQRAREVSVSLIDGANKGDISGILPTEARIQMVQGAILTLEELADDDPTPETRLEIIRGYIRLADAVGLGEGSNAGQRQAANKHLSKARQMLEESELTPETTELGKSVRLELLATSARDQLFLDDNARTATDLVLDARELFANLSAPKERDRFNLALADLTLSRANLHSGKPELSISAAQDSLRTFTALVEEYPMYEPYVLAQSEANSYVGQAIAWAGYYASEPYDEALPYYQAGVKIAERAVTSQSLESRRAVALALLRRANTTCYLEDHRRDGISDLETAEMQMVRLTLADPNNAQYEEIENNRLLQLSDCLFLDGQFDRAIESAKRAVERQRETLERDPLSAARTYRVIHTEVVLRWIQQGADQADEYCATADRIDELWQHYETLVPAEPLATQASVGEENRKIVAQCNMSGN